VITTVLLLVTLALLAVLLLVTGRGGAPYTANRWCDPLAHGVQLTQPGVLLAGASLSALTLGAGDFGRVARGEERCDGPNLRALGSG